MNVLIGLLIIIIDQIIKIIVSINISYGTSIGNWVKITNVSNTGIAYGMRTKQANNNYYSKHINNIFYIKVLNKKLQKLN